MNRLYGISVFSIVFGLGLVIAAVIGMVFEPMVMNRYILGVGLSTGFLGYVIKHYRLI
jgi:hypothetical protein